MNNPYSRMLRNPKILKLILDSLSIVFMFVIIWAVILFVFMYGMDIFKFTGSSDFVTVLVLGILSGVGFDIIKKKSIKDGTYKQIGNIRKSGSPHRGRRYVGTWTCPKCGALAKDNICGKCNYEIEKSN